MIFGCVIKRTGCAGERTDCDRWWNLYNRYFAIEMIPCVSSVSGGIFDFAEIQEFSPFGRYLREATQRVRSSASRYSVNGICIRKKHFTVLWLLQNILVKSPLLLPALGVVKITSPTSSCQSSRVQNGPDYFTSRKREEVHGSGGGQNVHDHFLALK